MTVNQNEVHALTDLFQRFKPEFDLRGLVPLKLKVFKFLIFLHMLFVNSYRLQKANFKVVEQALFLR